MDIIQTFIYNNLSYHMYKRSGYTTLVISCVIHLYSLVIHCIQSKHTNIYPNKETAKPSKNNSNRAHTPNCILFDLYSGTINPGHKHKSLTGR